MKAPTRFTRQSWWNEVGNFSVGCIILRGAISTYLEPGYYSSLATPQQVDRIRQEVGEHIYVDDHLVRIVWTEGWIKLFPYGELTREEWEEVMAFLEHPPEVPSPRALELVKIMQRKYQLPSRHPAG